MDLKKRTVTTQEVDSEDIDKFVRHHTGRKDYECVAAQEWSNDSQHTFNVTGELTHDFEKRDWTAFKEGRHSGNFILRLILDGLCSEGKLEKGNYTVKVSW